MTDPVVAPPATHSDTAGWLRDGDESSGLPLHAGAELFDYAAAEFYAALVLA